MKKKYIVDEDIITEDRLIKFYEEMVAWGLTQSKTIEEFIAEQGIVETDDDKITKLYENK